MLVRANQPHFSTDGALHELGGKPYELEGLELELRLKDGIVQAVSGAGLPGAAQATRPDPDDVSPDWKDAGPDIDAPTDLA